MFQLILVVTNNDEKDLEVPTMVRKTDREHTVTFSEIVNSDAPASLKSDDLISRNSSDILEGDSQTALVLQLDRICHALPTELLELLPTRMYL